MTSPSPKAEESRYARATRAVALVACWFAHGFPVNVIVALRYLGAITVAVLVAALAFRLLVPKRAPRVFAVATALYYAAVALYILTLSYYAAHLDTISLVLVFAYPVGFGFLFWRFGDHRRVWLPFIGLPAALVMTQYYGSVRLLGLVALALALPAARRFTPRQIGRPAVFAAGAVLVLTLRFGAFYYGGDESRVESVAGQPGVETILALGQNPDAWKRIGGQIRFAADNAAGTATLVGGNVGVAILPRNGGPARTLFQGMSGDELEYDPAAGRVVIGDYQHESLRVFDDATLSQRANVPVEGRAFTNVRIDPAGRWILTGDDFTRSVGRFSLERLDFDRLLPTSASRDALFDDVGNAIIAATIRRVDWIDPDTGATRASLKVPSIQIRMAADTANRKLYVSDFGDGEIWRVNLDTREVEKTLSLDVGVRFVELSPDKGTLFVSSYFRGQIIRVRVPELEEIGRIEAGRRVRTLHIAPGANALVFGSSLGAFRYRF